MSNFWDSVVLITSSDPDFSANFGTGFVIHGDDKATYLLTCAHVVDAVGGLNKVLAAGISATVIASGNKDNIDLAVLRVEGLFDRPKLSLYVAGQEESFFTIAGYYEYAANNRALREIRGNCRPMRFAPENGQKHINAWDLRIDGENLLLDRLRSGYSGSPVIDEKRGYVLGVVSHEIGTQGQAGFAISIDELEKIWPQMPPDLILKLITPNRIDYTRLLDMLATGKWEEADKETAQIMFKIARREQYCWLSQEDLHSFPYTDLHTIDQLWLRYSKGHFGLSVQKGIWESMWNIRDDDWFNKLKIFGDRVGWHQEGKIYGMTTNGWLLYRDLKFEISAPKGHLPTAVGQYKGGHYLFTVVMGCWGLFGLFSRSDL